jgi:hypothetical protein
MDARVKPAHDAVVDLVPPTQRSGMKDAAARPGHGQLVFFASPSVSIT